MSIDTASFGPVAAGTQVPIRLGMQRLWLTGRILPVGARLVVQHVFRSEEEQPLEVIYSFPLPRDAALRAFRITGEGFEAHSELRETQDAVKRYERGVAEGSLSALAREYGDGVVNLTVGNIRPSETVTLYFDLLAGVELRDDGYRFRFPFTLAPAYHSRMRVATSFGEGEVELPAGEFGDVILPRFRKDSSDLHEVGFDLDLSGQLPVAEIGSPSHAIRVKQNGAGPAGVALATGRDVPNRDLVLDVRFRESTTLVLAGASQEGCHHFAAVLPSTVFGGNAEGPRRTAIVLDRSGSMAGAPLTQARKAIEACLAVLSPEDSFGIVAFDDQIETMDDALVPGSREHRERARLFLQGITARGGTELAAGVAAAARALNGSGDLLILTDGQVAGTEQILQQARTANVRLFCLGIGSASQDRFLTLLARETGGISRFVGASERVDVAAVDLFASMGRPVASNLKASGNIQPEAPKDVFAGTPAILFGEIEDGANSTLELTWDGGQLTVPIPEGDAPTGEAVRLLQGSRLITDWEIRYPREEALAPIEKRKQSRLAMRLSDLSRTYGLASREMSLVAVVKRSGDRAGELPETKVVAVGMPQDTRFDAYFPAGGAHQGFFMAMAPPPPPMAASSPMQVPPHREVPMVIRSAPAGAPPPEAHSGLDVPAYLRAVPGFFKKVRIGTTKPPEPAAPPAEYTSMLRPSRANAEPPNETKPDLMDLAAQLEPDGGMPGKTASERTGRTVAAVLAFVTEGHTPSKGAFRTHVGKLVQFLKSVQDVSAQERRLIDRAIASAATGTAPNADWKALAATGKGAWEGAWKAIENALGA